MTSLVSLSVEKRTGDALHEISTAREETNLQNQPAAFTAMSVVQHERRLDYCFPQRSSHPRRQDGIDDTTALCRLEKHRLPPALPDAEMANNSVQTRTTTASLQIASLLQARRVQATEDKLLLRGGVFSICGTQAVKEEKDCSDLTTSDEQKNDTDNSAVEGYISIMCHEDENHTRYRSARRLGRELAMSMIKDGADVILKAAKNKTKEDILAEHAKRKMKAEMEAGTSTSSSAKVQKVEVGGGEPPVAASSDATA
ncbi:uncharacterized protein [Littorina saxatilis]|uniref:uncharacterized protein n=1 Tax=Littorina saxatilis TaxID=31220 RepID=UPI0038B5706B